MTEFVPATGPMVSDFLETIPEGTKHFRYFNTRPISVIQKHLITVILMDKGIAVAYGHLEHEDDRLWLGLAVADAQRGRGHGKRMLSYLTDAAARLGHAVVFLSVDRRNEPAIGLYRKAGFEVCSRTEDIWYLKRPLT